MNEFKVHAGWECRPGAPARCRWFCIWKDVPDVACEESVGRVFAGYYAGYSGGGTFEVEKFRGEIYDDELLSLWTVYEDLVNGTDINWEEVEEAVVETCDDALKVLWQWNNEDLWCDNDSLYINESRRCLTIQNGDMLTTSSGEWNSEDFKLLMDICALGGLTARPSLN